MPGSIGIFTPSLRGERRRPRARGEHEVVAADVAGSPCGATRTTVSGAVELDHLGALEELDAHLAQLRREPVDERVRLDVPLLREVEAGLDAIVERRLELVDLVLAEDVVRELVAVPPHPLEAAQHLPRVLRLGGGADHAELPEIEVDPVGDHRVDEVEAGLAERRQRGRAAVVVALVAVRPEARAARASRRGR